MKKTITCAALLCALLLPGCGAGYPSVLKANWGLDLPAYREVSGVDSGASFQGDGFRYHIYALENGEIAETLTDWSGVSGRANDTCLTDRAEEYLDWLEVPAADRPDYEYCMCWSMVNEEDDRDEILVFLDAETFRLYVVECFM